MAHRCHYFMIVALPVLQGCYTYVPAQTGTPPSGESVRLQINDRGRVVLGERMGPGISQVTGRLTETNTDQYAISVSGVTYISGANVLWSGESVQLHRDLVEQVQVRQLSKGRTWMAAGFTTAALVTFMASTGLLVDFLGGPGEDRPPDPPASLHFKLRFHF
jgi:hypothetical protein